MRAHVLPSLRPPLPTTAMCPTLKRPHGFFSSILKSIFFFFSDAVTHESKWDFESMLAAGGRGGVLTRTYGLALVSFIMVAVFFKWRGKKNIMRTSHIDPSFPCHLIFSPWLHIYAIFLALQLIHGDQPARNLPLHKCIQSVYVFMHVVGTTFALMNRFKLKHSRRQNGN